MKKQFIFCLSLLGLSLSACIDNVGPLDPPSNEGTLSIESVYPENLVRGSEVIIFGKNFGSSILDTYVTINGQYSEVTYVESGSRIVAIVPKDLSRGEHTLSLFANGQSCTRTCFIVED
jgi:hypothetical protein